MIYLISKVSIKKGSDFMSNSENNRSVDKTTINCLSCIYDAHHLNPYKMGNSKKWDLASFHKKVKKFEKIG